MRQRSPTLSSMGAERGDGSVRTGPFDEVPVTVTEAVEILRRHGYVEDFELVQGRLKGDGGNARCAIGEAVVERVYRFEGPSDPGDQMIVFGLLDPNTGLRGSLAAAYGPAADPDLYDHLTRQLRSDS